jgi:ABC-type multidrug transport system ATPase subunit
VKKRSAFSANFAGRKARLKNRVGELIELVGLTSARNQRLSTYSTGMPQRIGLAQALI